MKKIFITGGAGFIGSNATHYFYKKRWQVYIFDNLSRKSMHAKELKDFFSELEIHSLSNQVSNIESKPKRIKFMAI